MSPIMGMRALTCLMAIVLSVAVAVADARRPASVPRIGYLSTASPDADRSWMRAFREGLRELGYVEGEHLVIEERHGRQRAAVLPELAAELVRLDVKAIVAYGPPAILAAKGATRTIPIIFTVAADPVGAGFVASLARPGGNVTGLSDFHADMAAKRLELLREIVPAAARIGVLLSPANPTFAGQLDMLRSAAPRGVTVCAVDVSGPQEIERAFAALRRERADAVVIIPDPTWFIGQQTRIAHLAMASRLPAISTVREWAEAGGLVSYGADFHDSWRRAATYVDRVLKGARPADLPVEQPATFELVVNLKTARALGLAVPPALRLRANHLID